MGDLEQGSVTVRIAKAPEYNIDDQSSWRLNHVESFTFKVSSSLRDLVMSMIEDRTLKPCRNHVKHKPCRFVENFQIRVFDTQAEEYPNLWEWTAPTLLFHLAKKATKLRLLSEEYELRLNDEDVTKLGLSNLDNSNLPSHVRFLEQDIREVHLERKVYADAPTISSPHASRTSFNAGNRTGTQVV